MFDVRVFIDLVKARPALYNSNLFEYKSKRGGLWAEIGDIIDKNASQCRTVWTSLRSSYARHLQNMENNEKGFNKRKKSKWYLADEMSFLDEFMLRPPNERNTSSRNADINNTTSNTMSENFDYTYPNHTMDDSHSIQTIKSEDSYSELTNDNVNDFVQETEYMDPIDANYPIKRSHAELTCNDQNNLTSTQNEDHEEKVKVRALKQMKMLPAETNFTEKKVTTSEKTREESTILFFQSILYELRTLSDRKLRLFKQEVLQDLNKYLDEEEQEV